MLASHGPGTRSLHATRAGQTGLAGLSPRHLVHCLPVRASPRRVLASRWVGLGESSARLTIVRSRRRSGGAGLEWEGDLRGVRALVWCGASWRSLATRAASVERARRRVALLQRAHLACG